VGLIVLMLALQIIFNICYWYIMWLAFISNSNAPDQAMDVLELNGTTPSLLIVGSMFDLLTILKLSIADSIMVSTHLSLTANTNNNLKLEGLEVLDYMQQELDGGNWPPGLQYWVYKYVTNSGDR
jgi:hypothetical protein